MEKRKNIKWTNEHHARVAERAVELGHSDPRMNLIQRINAAQSVLPEEYRRRIISNNQLTRILPYIQEAERLYAQRIANPNKEERVVVDTFFQSMVTLLRPVIAEVVNSVLDARNLDHVIRAKVTEEVNQRLSAALGTAPVKTEKRKWRFLLVISDTSISSVQQIESILRKNLPDDEVDVTTVYPQTSSKELIEIIPNYDAVFEYHAPGKSRCNVWTAALINSWDDAPIYASPSATSLARYATDHYISLSLKQVN